MMGIVSQLLARNPLYEPVRRTYHRFFNRAVWREWKDRLEFYKQFIKRDALVFDVGAHVGEYSRTFLSLGARVIGIEPNPACLPLLQGIWGRIQIEPVGVGQSNGTALLRFGNASSLATLSEEWIDVASGSKRFALRNARWDNSIEIPLTTLDTLIEKYGAPDFIKIDVEGFELEAMMGLSRLPPFMSFEFNTEWNEKTRQCLSLVLFHGAWCNYVIGQPKRLELEKWVRPTDVMGRIEELSSGCYGDVLIASPGQQAYLQT